MKRLLAVLTTATILTGLIALPAVAQQGQAPCPPPGQPQEPGPAAEPGPPQGQYPPNEPTMEIRTPGAIIQITGYCWPHAQIHVIRRPAPAPAPAPPAGQQSTFSETLATAEVAEDGSFTVEFARPADAGDEPLAIEVVSAAPAANGAKVKQTAVIPASAATASFFEETPAGSGVTPVQGALAASILAAGLAAGAFWRRRATRA